jgi:hypothetical protein
MSWVIRGAKTILRLLAIELVVPGGTIIVLLILLAYAFDIPAARKLLTWLPFPEWAKGSMPSASPVGLGKVA